ncbi:hypothetical protein C8J56DRAFT_793738 [Mycena floridula]|nr:hypothetical protein C8J56DRAFT_793738 [Mycena floridula]
MDTGDLPDTWPQQFHSLIEKIVKPDPISWMDDDQGLPPAVYVRRAFDDIATRFERPLLDPTASSRLSLIGLVDNLGKLLSSSPTPIRNTQLSTINFVMPLAGYLLSGTDEQVTSEVRRKTFKALDSILKHHRLHSREDIDATTVGLFIKGMSDENRSVRLSAGTAFITLLELHGQQDARRVEILFNDFYRLMEHDKATVKETVLVIVGTMGRTGNPDVLGHVLCFLVAQLGRSNAVLNGLACMQILAITKFHKKPSPYPLLLPYLDKIAPFVVSRICTQPSLLMEYCRLVSIAPADFITLTLPRTLPSLFASRELKVLETVARELSIALPFLLLKHSHDILAHIFLLPDSAQTISCLAFVVQVLTDARSDVSIDVHSVVKSCVVSLLAEIVVILGDENRAIADQAVPALKKVQQALNPPRGNHAIPDLGAFLKSYMLGLISRINDMLQDVRGKKNLRSKQKIIRSLGHLVELIGSSVSNVAPQIMATFQTMATVPEVSEATLESWYKFLVTLGPEEVGPYVGPTSAALISSWKTFSERGQALAQQSINYIILEVGAELRKYLDDVVDLSSIPMLQEAQEHLSRLRQSWTPTQRLQSILSRAMTDNMVMAMQSLGELKKFMLTEHPQFIAELASGDMFDPQVGQILSVLFSAACRDVEGAEQLHLLAFECIGILGAADPDRCEIGVSDTRMVVMNNFTDETESTLFALHLIQDVLVGAFRSTSDIKYQSHLAYSIQELLRFCRFTPALVTSGQSSIAIKVRNRWNNLPKHVLETVTPLLEARFTLQETPHPDIQHPIYPGQSTYREWMQFWTSHLISRASGNTAQTVFGVFRLAVRNKDVVVAHYLLPHLILNILISGEEDDIQRIRLEILTVLQDQVDADSDSTSDKKLLSAQAIFMILDHLNKWVRKVRLTIATKKAETKRSRGIIHMEQQLSKVDSILENIDQNLMAKAALQCKAYARSLMNFESQIATIRARSPHNRDLPEYYERLHEIYAHLDEPDGMAGVSTLILSPSLEHQIREHESTGRWTSAQSCWEVQLQQSPDNVDFHLGLLRCLRNLGHYDTLRTHVRGALTQHPEWQSALVGFQVQGAWMVGAWDDVELLVSQTNVQDAPTVMARLLLAMQSKNSSAITEALSTARAVLGAPITASGVNGYRRSYDAVLNLHLTHELEIIYNTMSANPNTQSQSRANLARVTRLLSSRLDATLPTFRTREPVLSMRRAAFAMISNGSGSLSGEIARSWLTSAKIARKAGQWQTAYSAMLQAQQSKAAFSFMQSAKLLKETGEPLRALQELENSMKLLGLLEDGSGVVDLTLEHDDEAKAMKAKAQVLRARWMNESERFEVQHVFKTFLNATELLPEWESCHFHIGQYQDDCFKSLPPPDKATRGMKMNLYTVKSFAKAIKLGSKYVYQAVPRLLTIWLDLGENPNLASNESFKRLNDVVAKAIKETPGYKWFTAFPQVVSRVGHTNPDVYKHLAKMILKVVEEYPQQALWLFTSVIKSTKPQRQQRGVQLLEMLKSNPRFAGRPLPVLITQSMDMTNELLNLCNHTVKTEDSLSLSKQFPGLHRLSRSRLIIPLRESLTASLPPSSSDESQFHPFPLDAPTFQEIADSIQIMHSMAKPRKITIKGSNGQVYMFLGKPKDDLRKDARLMDFNTIINKLLKANSESRRRQLHIRTYGVVTLNEECGFIQWVPNTIPIRPVLVKFYESRGIRSWSPELTEIFKRVKERPDIFRTTILPMFPPLFHEWFIETFPEPSAWLASRLAYGRTAAVMSMVGFILGLGDRHLENILLDTNTGDVVHVDFNCLFDKGKSLETPERVPFRLTQNIIDALGVAGVEGVFRLACEVTMQILRDNKDSLMSVLDAFIHDPLVEWEDEKRKLAIRRNQNAVRSSVDLRMLAKNALNPIEKKLKGIYSASNDKNAKDKNSQHKEVSTSNLVQMLIQEATDTTNLAKMYPGWAPFH